MNSFMAGLRKAGLNQGGDHKQKANNASGYNRFRYHVFTLPSLECWRKIPHCGQSMDFHHPRAIIRELFAIARSTAQL